MVDFSTPLKKPSNLGASHNYGILFRYTGRHRPLLYFVYVLGLSFLSGSRSSVRPLLNDCHDISCSHCTPYLEKYDEVDFTQTSIFSLHSVRALLGVRPRYHACSHRPSSTLHGQTTHVPDGTQYSVSFSSAWNLASSY